jgi:hypothetical protein
MASWLQRQTPSHQVQIAGTALFSGLAVAGAILGIQALRRQSMVYDTSPSTVSSDTEYEKVCGKPPTCDCLHLNADYPSEGA